MDMARALITDLVQIRRLGEQKHDENFDFRRHLKVHDYPERRFRRIAEEIEDQIDCTQCGNCCRDPIVPLQDRDIDKLAKFLGCSRAHFIAEYMMPSPDQLDGGDPILKRTAQGCVFLEGKLCGVYEARPSICARYPHLVRGNGPLSTRMWQMVDRASVCPIVYNALEAYKDLLGFRHR